MANKIALPNQVFRSEAAAVRYFREILKRSPLESIILGPDEVDIRNLFARHPIVVNGTTNKTISHFITRFVTSPHCSKCFHVIWEDGSDTAWSYRTAIRGTTMSLEEKLNEAGRLAVNPDRFQVKCDHFNKIWDKALGNEYAPCEITGEYLHFSEADADHAPPYTFKLINELFLAKTGVKLTHDMFVKKAGGYRFTDPFLEKSYTQFHNDLARLRVVERKLNLSMGAST